MTTKELPAGVPEWTLGNRMHRALDYLRERTGEVLTATQMGEELGVDRATISRWMNDRGPVRAVYLRQWAMRCRVDYEWLRTGYSAPSDGPGGGLLNSDRYSSLRGVSVLTPRTHRTLVAA